MKGGGVHSMARPLDAQAAVPAVQCLCKKLTTRVSKYYT